MQDKIIIEFEGEPNVRNDMKVTFFGRIVPPDILRLSARLKTDYTMYLQSDAAKEAFRKEIEHEMQETPKEEEPVTLVTGEQQIVEHKEQENV